MRLCISHAEIENRSYITAFSAGQQDISDDHAKVLCIKAIVLKLKMANIIAMYWYNILIILSATLCVAFVHGLFAWLPQIPR